MFNIKKAIKEFKPIPLNKKQSQQRRKRLSSINLIKIDFKKMQQKQNEEFIRELEESMESTEDCTHYFFKTLKDMEIVK